MVLLAELQFMVTLSITRLISVKKPFFEIEWDTIKKFIIAEIAIAILTPIALTLFVNTDAFIAWIVQSVISFLWLLIMLVLATLTVFSVLNRSKLGLRADTASSRLDYNRIWKPIIRIATIQIAYVLCHLPMTAFSVVLILTTQAGYQTVSSEEIVRNEIITIWMYVLMEFYYGLNACLYMAQCVEIRRYFCHSLTCGKLEVEPKNLPRPVVISVCK